MQFIDVISCRFIRTLCCSARDPGTAVRVSVSGGDGGGVGAKVAVPRCGAGI